MSISNLDRTYNGVSRRDEYLVAEANRLKRLVKGMDTSLNSLTSIREDAYRETARLLARRHADRWALEEHLQRHFYTTTEVARLLGISVRLVRAMAAEGPSTVRFASGTALVAGLRAIRHRRLWFPKTDIDQLLSNLDRA